MNFLLDTKEKEDANKHPDRMQWTEDSWSDDDDIVYHGLSEVAEIKQIFTWNAFRNGQDI